MAEVINFPSKTPACDEIIRKACKSFNKEALPSIPLLAIDCIYPRCSSICKFNRIARHIMEALLPENQTAEDEAALKRVLEERFISYNLTIVPSDLRKLYESREAWQELWKEK